MIRFFPLINCYLLIIFVASQCAFGEDVPDWLKSEGDGSVRREEDWPVGGADGPWGGSQDGVAERWALQEVMWVRCRSSCTESQRVRGCCRSHCCGNSQWVGQEPCTQSFGEILGEGQRRLKTEERAAQDEREGERGGERIKMISLRRSPHAKGADIDFPHQTLLICYKQMFHFN